MAVQTRNAFIAWFCCREEAGIARLHSGGMKPIITSLALAVSVLLVRGVRGAVLTTLHAFTGPDGAHPNGGLVQGTDGNLYGTTTDDTFAPTNYGTVFKITPGGLFNTLHSLDGAVDGAEPRGLVRGNDGNFYGSAPYLGSSSWGTIFKASQSGEFTLLASLNAATGHPGSLLVPASDGNLFVLGTFWLGTGFGSLLSVTPAGAVSTLTTPFYGTNGFTGWSFSTDFLIQGIDGYLYGATAYGGPEFGGEFMNPAYGTVFQAAPDGTINTLFMFNGTNGAYVTALVQGRDGNLYGTTSEGGPGFIDSPIGGSGGFGTVFKLSTNGDFVTLVIFDGTNGIGPNSLIQASDGSFYGTTDGGGANGQGTIFKMTADGAVTSLFSFNGTNGAEPIYSTLLQTADGSFYGTTYRGGTSKLGTIFRLTINLPQLTITSFGANLVLTWPTNAAGFTLESTTNLVAPEVWTTVSPLPLVVNGQNTVTNPISSAQQFYRLAQ